MPYNPALDDKLRHLTAQWPYAERKKMFGGTGYLLNGNMVAGVYKDLLVLRVGKDTEEKLLAQPWCRPMDITGKPMKGWLFVEAGGWDNDERLGELVAQARAFVETLPAKK
jgi:TfoX/Sxy family transcriptional regulator of competence genes